MLPNVTERKTVTKTNSISEWVENVGNGYAEAIQM